MELQISHSLCTKISSTGFLWWEEKVHRRNIAEIMWVEGHEHSRSGMLSRPYSYVAWDAVKNERIGVYLTPSPSVPFPLRFLFPAFSLQSRFSLLSSSRRTERQRSSSAPGGLGQSEAGWRKASAAASFADRLSKFRLFLLILRDDAWSGVIPKAVFHCCAGDGLWRAVTSLSRLIGYVLQSLFLRKMTDASDIFRHASSKCVFCLAHMP